MDFLERFSENIQISNLIKIPPFGAELPHADEKTETDGQT